MSSRIENLKELAKLLDKVRTARDVMREADRIRELALNTSVAREYAALEQKASALLRDLQSMPTAMRQSRLRSFQVLLAYTRRQVTVQLQSVAAEETANPKRHRQREMAIEDLVQFAKEIAAGIESGTPPSTMRYYTNYKDKRFTESSLASSLVVKAYRYLVNNPNPQQLQTAYSFILQAIRQLRRDNQ